MAKADSPSTRSSGLPASFARKTSRPTLRLAWADGEIIRAIREGVAKDGRALFPMMPYQQLESMSDEDARSIVV
jgi:hypothetical protein